MPTLTVFAVPERVLPTAKIIGALRFIIWVESVRFPGIKLPLLSIILFTVIELSAVKLTLVEFKAVSMVELSMELSAELLLPLPSIVPLPPLATTVKSVGSNNQVPIFPCGELVLTCAVSPTVN